jgi:hypothetical protein
VVKNWKEQNCKQIEDFVTREKENEEIRGNFLEANKHSQLHILRIVHVTQSPYLTTTKHEITRPHYHHNPIMIKRYSFLSLPDSSKWQGRGETVRYTPAVALPHDPFHLAYRKFHVQRNIISLPSSEQNDVIIARPCWRNIRWKVIAWSYLGYRLIPVTSRQPNNIWIDRQQHWRRTSRFGHFFQLRSLLRYEVLTTLNMKTTVFSMWRCVVW